MLISPQYCYCLHSKGPLYIGFAHTRHATIPSAADADAKAESSLLVRGGSRNSTMKIYRSVPMVYNAATSQIWFGPHVSFPQPADALATPWTHYAGRKRALKDVQFPFGFHAQAGGLGGYVLALEYQDRCPAWALLSTHVLCSIFGPLLQTASAAE